MFGSAWGQSNQQQQNQQQPNQPFGAQNPQPSTFGTSGFGAFGSNTNQQQPQQPANPMFGGLGQNQQQQQQQQPPSTGFGGFGTNQGTSGFGAAKPAGFGGFGNTSTTPATTTGFSFGGTSNPAPTFGGGGTTSTTGGNLFGGQQQQGTNTTGTGFQWGAKPATPTTTGFGMAASAVPPNGTASPPYVVTQERDTSGTTTTTNHFQSITCMPAYKNASFEELRVQDYLQGRKTASATTFGGTTSTFGTTTTPAFGSTTTPATGGGGLFGGGTFGSTTTTTTPANPFGAPSQPAQSTQPTTTFGFGTTAANTNTTTPATGAFGQQTGQPNPSGFGGFGSTFGQNNQQQQQQQTQQASPFGAFGAPNTSNTAAKPFGGFGTTTTTPATNTFGAFGSTNTTTPASNPFGTTTTTTTNPSPFGAFGSNTATNNNAPKPFGTFGSQPAATDANKPATGWSLFGSNQNQQQQQQQQQPANPFAPSQPAQPQQSSTGLFGAFGQNQTQQGQTAAPSSGFNIFNKPATTTPATGTSPFGGFGSTTTAPSNPFGASTTTNQTSGTNLFGQTTTQAPRPNLFGSTTTTQPGSTGLFGSTAPTGSLFGQSTQQQPTLTASIDQPIGADLPVFALLPPGPQSIVLNPPKKKSNYFASIPTRSPVPRIGLNYAPPNTKLRGFGTSSPTQTQLTLKDKVNPFSLPASHSAGSPGKGSLSESRSLGPEAFRDSTSSPGLGGRQSVKKLVLDKKVNAEGLSDLLNRSTGSVGSGFGNSTGSKSKVTFSPALEVAARERERQREQERSLSFGSPTFSGSPLSKRFNLPKTVPTLTDDSPIKTPSSSTKAPAEEAPLKEGDYWTKPHVNHLKTLGFSELEALPDFTVGRVGYGEVTFLDPVDLTSVAKIADIPGTVVVFDDRECTVYPDESQKPDVGSGLNVPARITLEKCWAYDKATREPITDPEHPRYKAHIKKLERMKDTTFIRFEPEGGIWVFEVQHFSKYGLGETDDEEDVEKAVELPPPKAKGKGRAVSATIPKPAPVPQYVHDDMDEDELLPPPRRRPTANALVLDEEGDYMTSQELEKRRPPPPSTLAVPTKDITMGSPEPDPPAITPWAAKIRLEPHKVHVMQTSFFRTPEENRKAASPPAKSKPAVAVAPGKAATQFPLTASAGKRSRGQAKDWVGSDTGGEDAVMADVTSKERLSFSQALDPIPYRPSRKYMRVAPSESLASGQEANTFDAGLALGRSFRVSWGPGGQLAFFGNLCGPSDKTDNPNPSMITIKRVRMLASDQHTERKRAADLLDLQCSNAEIEEDSQGIPHAIPRPTLRFHHYASLFGPDDRSFEATIWRLGVALFDEIDLRLPESARFDIKQRAIELRRKTALSEWLEETVAPAVEADLRADSAAPSTQKAFLMMSGNQIERASETVMDSGHVRLATLVSQSPGDVFFRNDIAAQLDIWKEQRVDAHIDVHYRKIYALLAGYVDVLPGSNGSDPVEKCPDVPLARDLDWKRALGLHLWYGVGASDGDLSTVLAEFEQLFQETDFASRPLPWYRERLALAQGLARWNIPADSEELDAVFELMKMFVNSNLQLESVLCPRGFGPSPLDYRMTWHIATLLSRVLGLRGFGRLQLDMRLDLESEGYEGLSLTGDMVTSSYASQLEHLGMIEHAIFVLLHLEDAICRKQAIKELLSRNADKIDADCEYNLASLKIPIEWLHEAKASSLRYKGHVFEAYESFLKADQQKLAHDLAMSELAPDAVIRQDFALLRSLFKVIAPDQVDDWSFRGKLYIDYADVMENVPKLVRAVAEAGPDVVPDAVETSQLEHYAKTIPQLILALPDILRDPTNIRQQASLSEMLSGLLQRAQTLQTLRLPAQPNLQIQTNLVDEATRLRYIQSSVYDNFLKSIEVS